MKIAICDDNKSELEKIEKTLQEFIDINQANYEITVKSFINGSDLLSFINRLNDFDLLILDIIMPGINGIELAMEIRATNKNCKIIFLTSSPEFAVNSYKVNAFYYLLKPLDEMELMPLLNKALLSFQNEESNGFVIKEKTGFRTINIHTLEYVESVKHTLNFHLRGGDVVVCYAKIVEFIEVLLSDNRFIHCHQSYIVNMNCIIKFTDKYFVLSDKTQIPISRTFYPNVKKLYINYFFKKGDAL